MRTPRTPQKVLQAALRVTEKERREKDGAFKFLQSRGYSKARIHTLVAARLRLNALRGLYVVHLVELDALRYLVTKEMPERVWKWAAAEFERVKARGEQHDAHDAAREMIAEFAMLWHACDPALTRRQIVEYAQRGHAPTAEADAWEGLPPYGDDPNPARHEEARKRYGKFIADLTHRNDRDLMKWIAEDCPQIRQKRGRRST